MTAEDINAYVKERAGDEFTAKDFRTLHGTVAAAVDLAQTGVLSSQAKRKKAISHAVKAASEVLGNTPTVARQSYIDPPVARCVRARRDHRPGPVARRRVRGPGPALPAVT
ncbi:hypothetical protein [Curtobacterium sp. MCJR17_043]|uniref:hypothetical protein n=1 Tax=Curtobacterium sp. MCJR17_043 TaxID=2175660 RepID=UPI0024DFF49B|nr:hypothetical protein [Curtobacterium sp. MCJR17_043]WIB35885.1 hypothetical protein DEJ15_00730 [Curtobacterium sp. MCJR17_043]